MFNIVLDLTFFVPFFENPTVLEEMLKCFQRSIHRVKKVQSPLEAMGQFDPSKPVMTIDAYFDSMPPDMRTDNYDRFNWLDAVHDKIYWIHPYSIEDEHFRNAIRGGELIRNVKVYDNVFPSPSVLERSEVFIEMNMYVLKHCPRYVQVLFKKYEIYDPMWFKFGGTPVDYSESFSYIAESREHFHVNFQEVFLR